MTSGRCRQLLWLCSLRASRFLSGSDPLGRPPPVILNLDKHKCLLIIHLRIPPRPLLLSATPLLPCFAFVCDGVILHVQIQNWPVWAGLEHTLTEGAGPRMHTRLLQTGFLLRIFSCLPFFLSASSFSTSSTSGGRTEDPPDLDCLHVLTSRFYAASCAFVHIEHEQTL